MNACGGLFVASCVYIRHYNTPFEVDGQREVIDHDRAGPMIAKDKDGCPDQWTGHGWGYHTLILQSRDDIWRSLQGLDMPPIRNVQG
jgi:hypothetical protein